MVVANNIDDWDNVWGQISEQITAHKTNPGDGQSPIFTFGHKIYMWEMSFDLGQILITAVNLDNLGK